MPKIKAGGRFWSLEIVLLRGLGRRRWRVSKTLETFFGKRILKMKLWENIGGKDKMVTKEEVMKVLEEVVDPHFGVSIVDMGFIYDIEIDDKVHVKMTLTTPACPLARTLLGGVKRTIEEKLNMEADIELSFEPKWSPEMMGKAAREKLGWSEEQ